MGRGGFFRWTSLRDERGVPMLRITETTSPDELRHMHRWMPVAIALVCNFPGCFCLVCRWFGYIKSPMPPLTMWVYASAIGFLFTLFALSIIRARMYVQSLLSAAEIAAAHGIEEAAVRSELERLGIRPAFQVNGLDRYDPDTIDPAALLLRPAGAATGDAARLLRPDVEERLAA